MTIRDDIRGHFAREEARFPTPAGLRESVSEEAARDGAVERRTLNWAAVVAVGLAVAIVAGLLAAGSMRHSFAFPVFPGPSPKPTVPATPGDMNLIEIDAVDSANAFALLATLIQPNNRPQFWFSRTTDGGAHWSKPAQVGPHLANGEGDSGHHIHFVDRENGFIYGNSTAFVTHDGGRSWKDSGLHFLEMVVAAGRSPWTWAVIYPCAKGVQCPYKVYLSKDGGRTWPQSWDLPDGIDFRFVTAFGDGGLLIPEPGIGNLFLTTDGGVSWKSVQGRCSGDTAAAYAATADGRELWEACSASFLDFTPKTLFVSENGGATWVQKKLPAGLGRAADLVSPTPGTAFLVSDQGAVFITTDEGASWTPIPGASSFVWLTFTSPSEGWALSANRTIWVTTDGGRTWVGLGRP